MMGCLRCLTKAVKILRWRREQLQDQERTRLLGFYRSQGIEHWVRFWERYTKEVR